MDSRIESVGMAASTLSQLKELQNEVNAGNERITRLKNVKNKHLKDNEKYQHALRKLAYKLGGKKRSEELTAKAVKGEADYLETVQALSQAENILRIVRAKVLELEKTRGSDHNEVQFRINTESKALAILHDAEKQLSRCLIDLDNASTNVKIFASEQPSQHPLQPDLDLTTSLASRAELLFNQARKLQPLIQPLPPLYIYPESQVYRKKCAEIDFNFDPMFKELSIEEKIYNAKCRVEGAAKHLETEIGASARRLSDMRDGMELGNGKGNGKMLNNR